MNRTRMIPFALGFCALFGAHQVAADATLAIETGTSDPMSPQITRVYLRSDRLKLEMAAAGATGGAREVIFRADQGKLWIVDVANKSYRMIDQKQMAELGQRMNEALAGLSAEIDKLPPEQRQRVEQLMMGEKPSLDQAVDEFRKTDRKQTIDGFECVGYDYIQGEQKSGEAWLASWTDIGLDPKTFQVFERFQQFFAPAGAAASSSALKRELRADLANLSRLDGFPVLIRDVKDTRIVSESHMRVIDRGPLPDDRFAVPSGFTETLPQHPSSGGKK
jgi:uncharacterized protein DUF4412